LSLRKTGLVFIFGGAISLVLITFLIQYGYFSNELFQIIIILSSLLILFLGIAFYFFYVDKPQRRKIIIWLSSISLFLSVFGWICKFNHWPTASLQIIFSIFIFCFSCLPLIVKARFDKWVSITRKPVQSLLLSLGDLLSIILILIALLCKVQHWPGFYLLGSIGCVLLIVTFLGWNKMFKNEVQLRQVAESKLASAFDDLKSKHELIEEKNREIRDSINYAKRIQYTLLAHAEFLQINLNEHFVFFKPKDIVSGDFYWATSFDDDKKNEKMFLAVCDSTGHGVPGAFMSLLNISFLNEAINEKNINEPHKVFEHVRSRLISTISADGAKDGMDGILLLKEKNSTKIHYAAANNAPVVIRNGVIIELPYDKMPVGLGEVKTEFSLFEVELQKEDVLFLYTDGYADQFGGPKGKKYKYKNLNAFLSKISASSLANAEEKLNDEIEQWKGDLEQVDDLCIIGIRI
jgi:serine phosphatase RsbU (regulator of sigma subunit)